MNNDTIQALSDYLRVTEYQYTFLAELESLVNPDNGPHTHALRSDILEKLIALQANQEYLKKQLNIIETQYRDIQHLIDIQYSTLNKPIL